jgi:hypothetical protein
VILHCDIKERSRLVNDNNNDADDAMKDEMATGGQTPLLLSLLVSSSLRLKKRL